MSNFSADLISHFVSAPYLDALHRFASAPTPKLYRPISFKRNRISNSFLISNERARLAESFDTIHDTKRAAVREESSKTHFSLLPEAKVQLPEAKFRFRQSGLGVGIPGLLDSTGTGIAGFHRDRDSRKMVSGKRDRAKMDSGKRDGHPLHPPHR